MKTVVARFPCVLRDMRNRQQDDPAAGGFYTFFCKIENIGMLLIDADVLPLLASQNTSQQDPDLDTVTACDADWTQQRKYLLKCVTTLQA